MDLQTWGILLFFFGPLYIIWISAQFKGESPGRALGIVILVLVANVAVPIAFAILMHWSLGLGVFLLGLLFIRFMRNRDVRTQEPFSPLKTALSSRCLELTFSLNEWETEDRALKHGADPQPCPCCQRRGFYAPREADDGRRYRCCKFCGFWQDLEKHPHEIIRYECRASTHRASDWKEPHESWSCPECQTVFEPANSVAWPVDDTSHPWRNAPLTGTQEDYCSYWRAEGSSVPPFGIK